MDELQHALRCRAQSAMALLQQGICKTEQKLEQCLDVLANVQEEVRQHQQAQALAIQQDYNLKLHALTEAFEQQVLSLENETHAQLEGLQSAAEDALHDAAQMLLQELQLDHPVEVAAAAAVHEAGRTSTDSPAHSEVGVELSMAALQADTAAEAPLRQQESVNAQQCLADLHHHARHQPTSRTSSQASNQGFNTPSQLGPAPDVAKAQGRCAPPKCTAADSAGDSDAQDQHVTDTTLHDQVTFRPVPAQQYLQKPRAEPHQHTLQQCLQSELERLQAISYLKRPLLQAAEVFTGPAASLPGCCDQANLSTKPILLPASDLCHASSSASWQQCYTGHDRDSDECWQIKAGKPTAAGDAVRSRASWQQRGNSHGTSGQSKSAGQPGSSGADLQKPISLFRTPQHITQSAVPPAAAAAGYAAAKAFDFFASKDASCSDPAFTAQVCFGNRSCAAEGPILESTAGEQLAAGACKGC